MSFSSKGETMKYYICVNNHSEGWSMDGPYEEIEVIEKIKSGDTYGSEFKIMCEIELKMELSEAKQ